MIVASVSRRNLLRNLAVAAGTALVCASLAMLAITNISFLSRVNQFVQDWQISVFAPHEKQDPDIVVVAIDEATLAQFAYRSPVDRKFVADLLTKLAAHAPAAIGLDLLLDQPTEPAKDAALHDALRRVRVPLVVSYVADPDKMPDEQRTVSDDQKAYEDAMVPVHLRGLADLPTDQFDTARWVFPGKTVQGGFYLPSFARALAAAAGKPAPALQTPIIWRGRPLPTATDSDPKPFLQISALAAGLMPDSWFRGKIVLIGTDVTLVDRHRTPFSSIEEGNRGQLPGIVIQAHGLSQLLHNKVSPLIGWPADFALTLLFALLGAGLGVANGRLLLRAGAALAAVLLLWAGGIALFHVLDVMVGLLAPPLALIGAFVGLDSLGGRDARRQRAFIQGAFSRYVSPKVVEQMVENPARMSLAGERRLMTYLFSDIQNFTTMSEKLESHELARLLNAYLDGMTGIVLQHGGMVDKFIGDAVFAIFNAPIDLPDHAQQAVRCMLALDNFTESFRKRENALGIPLGITRIGVHTGIAVVGNFGSQARFTYTAQGDAVNTAARLEGINKHFGTRLCVSDATRALCRDIAFRPVASVILKGKTEAMELWEPLAEGVCSPQFLEAYRQAFEALREKRPEARDQFVALLADSPDDPCVRLHIERLKSGLAGIDMVMTEK